MTQQQEIVRLKRLKAYIQKLGGHQQVVQQSGISSAQLYRYLQGTPIPHERLLRLAQLGGVSTDWLLHGDSPGILQLDDMFGVTGHVVQTVLTALQFHEVGPTYRPSELKDLIPLFIINELNQRSYQPDWELTEEMVVNALDVVRQLRVNRQLTPYIQHLLQRYQYPEQHFKPIWAGPFCEYVDTAIQSYFESRSGKNYYDRVAHNFKPINLNWIKSLVKLLEQRNQTKKLNLLDFGSGTCRYLRYLYRNHTDWFELNGIERSSTAWEYIEEFERSGDLPKATVRQENWLNHSFPKESMDVVTSYMGIHYFPYIPDSIELGLGKALFEMAHVLRPKGIMHIVLRGGFKETYLPYYSRAHRLEEIEEFLKNMGLSALNTEPYYEDSPSLIGHEVPFGFSRTASMFFVKN